MNNTIKNQAGLTRELFDTTQDVGIIIGENQNIDTVGAALGLYLLLKGEGKNVQVVAKKTPEVSVSNLFGVDKISKSFEGSTKILTITVPYREGEIEKVSYNIEGDKLNVNLFAEQSGITFTDQDIQYIRKGSSPALIVTIGVTDERELTNFVDPASAKMIHIDRNPMNSLVGDVMIVDSSFSSVSEIVAEMVRDLALMPDPDAFQNLMDGINFATRNFTSPQTSGFAFEAAGYLLQNGAKRREENLPKPQNQPRDDRNRNFPREDQFLNQRPPRVSGMQQQGGSNNAPRQNQPQNGPLNRNLGQQQAQQPQHQQSQRPQQAPRPQVAQNPQINQAPQPYRAPQPQAPKESQDLMDLPDELSDSSFSEGAMPDDIPDDWFLPKVFKGSKKGNN